MDTIKCVSHNLFEILQFPMGICVNMDNGDAIIIKRSPFSDSRGKYIWSFFSLISIPSNYDKQIMGNMI